MKNNLNDVIMRAQAEIWAIWPEALQAALIADPAIDNDLVAAATRPGPKTGRVATVPIIGGIAHRASFWSDFFGGATVERLTKTLRDYGADPTISTVVLEVDSPGGTVSGVPELAAEVRRLKETKHVVALVNDLAASAAYWVASQADEIVATPEAMVGSIGVFTYHIDYSKFMEQRGVNVTYVHAGKYKVEANPDEPLSDEARDHIQSLVDADYALFVGDVARGRGVSAATVRSDYGQGRVLTAADAKAAGMIDRISTSAETIGRLVGKRADDLTPIIEGKRLAMLKRRLDLAEKI